MEWLIALVFALFIAALASPMYLSWRSKHKRY